MAKSVPLSRIQAVRGTDRTWLLYPSPYVRRWLRARLAEAHHIDLPIQRYHRRRFWAAERETWMRVLLALGLDLEAGEVPTRYLPAVRELRRQIAPVCGYSLLLAGEPDARA